MDCELCNYKVFDHYVEESPRIVYTCGHPDGLTDEGDCKFNELDAIEDHSQAHGEGRLQDERTSEPKIRY